MTLGKCEESDLIDRSQVTGGQVYSHEMAEFRNPEPPLLYVHMLPTNGLDV